jgi:four helix bundle protein
MKKTHNFRELKIWQESMNLVKQVYALTTELPANEKFGLISQIQRCAISIPSNIAEGSGRSSEKEFLHFLNISISSSYELETQLILLDELYKINTQKTLIQITSIQKMIGGFCKKLRTDLNQVKIK